MPTGRCAAQLTPDTRDIDDFTNIFDKSLRLTTVQRVRRGRQWDTFRALMRDANGSLMILGHASQNRRR